MISSETYNNLRLVKDDILICRTNGNPNLVGKAAVVMENTQYAFASYLFRVKVNTLILPETLTVFLNSKYGRIEIDKNYMKGNQTNFSPAKFKDIRIPIFNSAINKFIATMVSQSYEYNKCANNLYFQAEQMLLDELNLSDFVPSDEQVIQVAILVP